MSSRLPYKLFFIIVGCCLCTKLFSQSTFTVDALKEDLHFYHSKLVKHHPNLYLYNTKERVDHFFDSLEQSIIRPLNEAEFYNIITLSSAIVKDGHTLILPSASWVSHHNANSKFLPLQLGIAENTLFVKMNCSPNRNITEGAIIKSINGVNADEIMNSLLARQVRDGNNISYALWIIDQYFREYYSYVFGHPDVYEISFSNEGISQTIQLEAMMKDSIYYYRELFYPGFDNKSQKGIDLKVDKNLQSSVLTIRDFHTGVLKSKYHQDFKKVIKNCFDSILSGNSKNLVIDLRNNQGGDVENGVYLLSYLVDQPFKVVNEYVGLKGDQLKNVSGPCMGVYQPKKNSFHGNLYVVVNGGSFSNSVIVSTCLRNYTKAVFMGCETGGNPNVLAGYAKEFILPNTKIRVEIPTKRFVMTDLDQNNGRGLVPDLPMYPSIPNSLNDVDEEMLWLIELARQTKNN